MNYHKKQQRKYEELACLTLELSKCFPPYTPLNGKFESRAADIAHLVGSEEREISLEANWTTRRLEISGKYPREGNAWPFNKWANEIPPRITVSMGRPYQAIAQDMRRRFMDRYEYYYQLAIQRRDEQRDYIAAHDATIDMIGRLLNESPYGLGALKNCFSPRLTRGHVKVEVIGPTSINIDMNSLSPDLARFLLQSLMEYLTTGEPT